MIHLNKEYNSPFSKEYNPPFPCECCCPGDFLLPFSHCPGDSVLPELLHQMKLCRDDGKVVFMGATNRPHQVDGVSVVFFFDSYSFFFQNYFFFKVFNLQSIFFLIVTLFFMFFFFNFEIFFFFTFKVFLLGGVFFQFINFFYKFFFFIKVSC